MLLRLVSIYYRRDGGCHFKNWKVIVDARSYFSYGQSCFLGHLTDSRSFEMIPAIGHGRDLHTQRNAYHMAGSGYSTGSAGYPLLVQFSRCGERRLTLKM